MYGKRNLVKECIREGKTALGTWVQMASPEIVEAVGYQGYQFVIIDMEHGHFGFDTAYQMVRAADAAGITAVVRIPANEESMILKVLDTGAMGVLVPGIGSKAEAEKAVAAAKYAPRGNRGACPWTRAGKYCTSEWNQHAQWSNEETMVWLLVEGQDGVKNFDEILSVPDVDALMMGPFDLSQSMGIAGQLDHPLLLEALNAMTQKAKAKNVNMIAVMLSELTPAEIQKSVRKWSDLGCNIMTIGGDRGIICKGFKAILDSAREVLR